MFFLLWNDAGSAGVPLPPLRDQDSRPPRRTAKTKPDAPENSCPGKHRAILALRSGDPTGSERRQETLRVNQRINREVAGGSYLREGHKLLAKTRIGRARRAVGRNFEQVFALAAKYQFGAGEGL